MRAWILLRSRRRMVLGDHFADLLRDLFGFEREAAEQPHVATAVSRHRQPKTIRVSEIEHHVAALQPPGGILRRLALDALQAEIVGGDISFAIEQAALLALWL